MGRVASEQATALGGPPGHQELPPRRAGQAPGDAAREYRDSVGQHGLQVRAVPPMGLNAKAACGSKQPCAGLEAGIKGVVHAVLEQSTAEGGMHLGGGGGPGGAGAAS